MKIKLFTFISLLLSLSAFAQIEVGGSTDGKPAPKFWIESNTLNLGNVPLSEPVTVTFEIKNTGNAPLIITKAVPTCDCTLVDYSKNEIAPAEIGFVTVTYDAKILGKFDKRVFISTNAYEGAMDLTIKGEVIYIPK